VLVATVAVGAAALLGWLVWAALAAAGRDLHSQVLEFRVLDDHRVSLRIEVAADREQDVTCVVQAQDRFRETVGVGRVAVPAGRRVRQAETLIETRDRAVTATVAGCRPAGGAG
jgi:hypothetical protein